MFAIRGKALGLQVIWIGGNWGTMVPIARWGDIWQMTMELAIMGIQISKPISAPLKFHPMTTLAGKEKGEKNDPLNNFGGEMHGGEWKMVAGE